jgi:YebC/PmpR family DNA-binding regulatory protein
MAGHSKWANIQHRKAKQDKKRGKIFTKLIRMIQVAARVGGGDLSGNPKLRDLVDKAKAANMSNDTIDRAIKKGAGDLECGNMEEVVYEGYGPAGVAVMVECLTDNRNRTVGEIRHAFSKCGGNLGTDGSVSYLFSKRGMISFAPGAQEDKIMQVALESGADDVVVNDDESIDVFTIPEEFIRVKEYMQLSKLQFEEADIRLIPATYVDLDKETAEKMQRLQDMLEDLDDVQNVYSNAEISEEILQLL